jgi:hypothetical protein
VHPGETHRFVGPAGVEFVTTVGVAFDAEYIQKMVDTGEWKPVPEPARKPAARKVGRNG